MATRLRPHARRIELPLPDNLDDRDPLAPQGASPKLIDLLASYLAKGGANNPQCTAATLVNKHGHLGAILAADAGSHIQITGDPKAAAQIQELRDLISEALRFDIERRALISDSSALHRYLHHEMAFDPVEKMRVLFLNTKNRLISDEILGLGTLDRVSLHIRELFARALQLNASSVILIHNHPSGDPAPSTSDLDITRRVIQLGDIMNLKVIDHLIISRTGSYSLKANNQI